MGCIKIRKNLLFIKGFPIQVEGSVGSVVVPLEVGGAGSLLPRAPVSVEEDDCAFLLTGFPVIFI